MAESLVDFGAGWISGTVSIALTQVTLISFSLSPLGRSMRVDNNLVGSKLVTSQPLPNRSVRSSLYLLSRGVCLSAGSMSRSSRRFSLLVLGGNSHVIKT